MELRFHQIVISVEAVKRLKLLQGAAPPLNEGQETESQKEANTKKLLLKLGFFGCQCDRTPEVKVCNLRGFRRNVEKHVRLKVFWVTRTFAVCPCGRIKWTQSDTLTIEKNKITTKEAIKHASNVSSSCSSSEKDKGGQRVKSALTEEWRWHWVVPNDLICQHRLQLRSLSAGHWVSTVAVSVDQCRFCTLNTSCQTCSFVLLLYRSPFKWAWTVLPDFQRVKGLRVNRWS